MQIVNLHCSDLGFVSHLLHLLQLEWQHVDVHSVGASISDGSIDARYEGMERESFLIVGVMLYPIVLQTFMSRCTTIPMRVTTVTVFGQPLPLH